jgi:hypothetical protein
MAARVPSASLTSEIRAEIEKAVSVDLNQAMASEFYVPYDFQFRASRLPFCSREVVIHRRWPLNQRPVRSEDYSFNFYVRIGHAVHEHVQQYLGMISLMFGNWTCCGITEKMREGSATCPVCGKPQKYEEFEVDSELGMHVDAVLKRYNAVGEFKTTSSENLKKLTSPYPKHMVQASCYLASLNAQFGWSLDKLIFVYFSRNRPKEFAVFVREPLHDVYDEALKQFAKAKDDLYSGTMPARICSSTYEGHNLGCSYYGVCFRDDLEQLLISPSSLVRRG